MKIYGIYDNKDKEQCVIIGTLVEIAKFFGLSARAIDGAIRRGTIGNRYDLVYLFQE